MAEQDNNLPVVNEMRSVRSATVASGNRITSNVSSGLRDVSKNIQNMGATLQSLASNQLRAIQEQIEQDSFNTQRQIDSQEARKPSFLEYLNTLLQFQTKNATSTTAEIVGELKNIDSTTARGQNEMRQLFQVMGEMLGSMNAKLADIAASSMHQLDFMVRQERTLLNLGAGAAGKGRGRGRKEPTGFYGVNPQDIAAFTRYRGVVSDEERMAAIERGYKSITKTLDRQLNRGDYTNLFKKSETLLQELRDVGASESQREASADQEQSKNNKKIVEALADPKGPLQKIKEVLFDFTDDQKKRMELAGSNKGMIGSLLGMFGTDLKGGSIFTALAGMAGRLSSKVLWGAARLVTNPYIAALLLGLGAMYYFQDEFEIPEAPKKEDVPKMLDESKARGKRAGEIAVELDKFEKGETYLTPEQKTAFENELQTLRAQEEEMKKSMDSYYRQKILDANKAYNESTYKGGVEEEAKKLGISVDEYKWRMQHNKLPSDNDALMQQIENYLNSQPGSTNKLKRNEQQFNLSPQDIESIKNYAPKALPKSLESSKAGDGAPANRKSSDLAFKSQRLNMRTPAAAQPAPSFNSVDSSVRIQKDTYAEVATSPFNGGAPNSSPFDAMFGNIPLGQS